MSNTLADRALATLLVLSSSAAGQDLSDVVITTVPVADGLYMLQGAGGNIGASVGEDGVILVDDQFAPLTDRILEAVGGISREPVRFLVNTHWHQDHTGGNENMGKLGAVIVAHENVRVRMSTEQVMEAFGRTVPPSPPEALPKLTFAESVTFHWNGGPIDVFHVERAHTDGDAIIHFRTANAFHMGDTFFNGMYPFIDVSSGGSIDGMIATADRILALCDDETRIIPGHGPLATVDDLRAYRDMLSDARARILALVEAGRSRDDVVAAGPTAELDATWGGGFMPPDVWVGIVYDSLSTR